MTEYLKHAPLYSQQATEEVRRAVSEMLLDIERERAAGDPPLLTRTRWLGPALVPRR